jgi:hypothetical protein
MKKNNEAISQFANNMTTSLIKQLKISENATSVWNSAYENYVSSNVKDLQSPNVINELGVRKLVNLC